jgi:fatty acid desaturase (delta-4 desaturase)
VYPLPAKSKIFNEIQTRVKKEILPAYGLERGRGGNVLLMHASCVMVYWLASIWAVVHYNTLFAGVLAGLGAAWIGFGVQHTANHGGLTDYPLINRILGFTDDLACNGSSLVWRYHHHVSHHVYTNDVSKDQDVYSSFPMLRFDLAQKREWYHAFQVYYTPVLLLFLYWSAQFADISCLLSERAYGVRFLGLSDFDRRQFWTGKAMHVFVYLLLPIYYHGLASALACFFVFTAVGSFVLSWFFLVSHNVLETKPDLISAAAHKDWG